MPYFAVLLLNSLHHVSTALPYITCQSYGASIYMPLLAFFKMKDEFKVLSAVEEASPGKV